MEEDKIPYIELIKESVYELQYKDVLPKDIAVRYLAIPPDLLNQVLIGITTGLAGSALYDMIKAKVKSVLSKKEGGRDLLIYFKKIAISAIDKKDGSLAVYSISDSIKLHPYQNVALFGIEGTPVLDFRDMGPKEVCFKLGKNSTLFLKNLKIRKYTTQKLFEGDGRVIYDERDVIIEDIGPPGEETEEIHEREGYFEIEFL
ncbi:hypothetical protein [Thermococcus sp. 2319x1]|uniref:hypothetical protein n=1 Tax=Thermococcus sp. 2319x1 TaxID=1674923 RepID=UPI0015817275|nr:hypothetical protein [Thermococcus sp. 2319x1]